MNLNNLGLSCVTIIYFIGRFIPLLYPQRFFFVNSFFIDKSGHVVNEQGLFVSEKNNLTFKSFSHHINSLIFFAVFHDTRNVRLNANMDIIL